MCHRPLKVSVFYCCQEIAGCVSLIRRVHTYFQLMGLEWVRLFDSGALRYRTVQQERSRSTVFSPLTHL